MPPDRGGIHQRFEGVLSRIQNPARLVGGEIGAGSGFAWREGELRVVLAFPEAYEVGISNQALQILYHVAGTVPGVTVERAYLPWVDAIAELRREAIPLLTQETWTPVRTAHLLGITLQHELNYTNVLELLDLAGVPVRAADRGEDAPLVVAGGPATADFLPMSAFLDAVVVGDGEEVLTEVLKVLLEAEAAGEARAARLRRLAGIRGVFVPGLSGSVQRVAVERLEDAPYPEHCLVPLTAGVHDRSWVEVSRGCSRGCRFCQAGMWYRPVRERSRERILELARTQLRVGGHQELSLGSLSVTDHSELRGVLSALAVDEPDVRVALPSLRVDSAAVKLGHLTSPTSPSLTLAPEAGSQRMRDVINKNVDEADIFGAAREAFTLGHTTLKLYFMMGLPTETDEDVEAIVDLCLRLRRLGKEQLGSRGSRLKLNVSVTNFIPKAFTPFQWVGMADRGVLERRRHLLRRGLAVKGIKLALHDIDSSYVEAALARGGEECAAVIEAAWKAGARFDSWTEQARPAAWASAFEQAGTSAEELATRTIPADAALPWDVIEGVVSKEFLLEEWGRAMSGLLTPDCRTDECSDCGVCVGGLQIEEAASAASATSASAESGLNGRSDASLHQCASGPGSAPEGPLRRYLLTFSATGRARYLGHLDTMELFRRAVRRAGGRLALSGGLRPKPLLSLAMPRGVGVEGRAELAEFTLQGSVPHDFAERLQEALPGGFKVRGFEPYHHKRSAAARVIAAHYRVVATPAPREEGGSPPPLTADVLREAVSLYTCSSGIIIERHRPDGIRQIDVRAYVERVMAVLEEETVVLGFVAAVTPAGTVRPEEVVAALSRLAGVSLAVTRVERLSLELDGTT
ncbi:MAG: TIGR03936 family radical SAM-associated protein [Thermoleophilia bacterium]